MRVHISEPRFIADLVGFFASTDYLAVRKGQDVLDVVPMNPVSNRSDRIRLVRYLKQWEEEQSEEVRAEIIE